MMKRIAVIFFLVIMSIMAFVSCTPNNERGQRDKGTLKVETLSQ
jgi:hypothetical protein